MKVTVQLGTVGVTLKGLYADVFLRPYFGLFVNDGICRRWYSLPKGKLLKVQIIDPEQAARIARRTLKPWALVQTITGQTMEIVSYPYVEDTGFVRVLARAVPGEPASAVPVNVERLRPWDFRRKTGIPANDPV